MSDEKKKSKWGLSISLVCETSQHKIAFFFKTRGQKQGTPYCNKCGSPYV